MRLRINVFDHADQHDDPSENVTAYVRRLGIKFERFTPQEIADQVMFESVDMSTVPDDVPKYFRFSPR